MKNILSKRKRLLRALGIVLITLVIVIYIGIPTVIAVIVVTPFGAGVGEPPDGFRAVTLTTEDNIKLAAWYAEPQNGAVIIMVHGAGSGRGNLTKHADMLREHGFGVLALNTRGFGDSEGSINRLGWNGTQDIGAAMDFLAAQDEVETIGGLGLSMGGEILLGAASEYPALQAVVSEGATFRSLNEFTALPENRSVFRGFQTRYLYFWVDILSGDKQPETTLLESIEQADTTSFLFIASGKDNTEIAYNRLFGETAQARGSVWIVPGASHTSGLEHDHDVYEQRVVNFFTSALLTE